MPELKLGLNDMLSGAGGGDGPDSMGPSSMGRESPGGYSSGGGGGGSREAGCGATRRLLRLRVRALAHAAARRAANPLSLMTSPSTSA